MKIKNIAVGGNLKLITKCWKNVANLAAASLGRAELTFKQFLKIVH